MQDQQSRRSIPVGVIAGISAAILVTGSGVAWWSWNSARKTPEPSAVQQSPPSAPTTTNPPGSTAAIPSEKSLQVYWLKTAGDRIELAASPVKSSSSTDPNTMLESAVNQLLQGSSDPALTSTIPANTKLRSVAIKPDGIHIDLSQEFTAGGGSTSMAGRLAQVLYTTTSLNPDTRVWLSVEGKRLEVLGGEGLVLEQPLTRKSFEQDFPL
jgi:spore germination protein GerM